MSYLAIYSIEHLVKHNFLQLHSSLKFKLSFFAFLVLVSSVLASFGGSTV